MHCLARHLAVLATFSFGLVASASAADLALRRAAPVQAPPRPPVYSWTGFYVGGNIGGAWSADWNSSATASGPNVIGTPTESFGQNASGVVGGGQIGYNWQFAPTWAVGIEADLQAADLSGSSTLSGFAGFAGITSEMDRKLDWFGTVRGRIGYVWDRWMAYATGGFAYGGVKYNANIDVPAGVSGSMTGFSFPVSLSDTKTGWTAGAGLEWAFLGNWSAKAEYLYVSLDSADASSFGVPSQAPNIVNYHWNDTNFHVVRFGLNYKFGGPY